MIQTYTHHGHTFDVQIPTRYVFLGDKACAVFEMRGDPALFFGAETIIVQSEALDDGFVRYWTQSADAEIQSTTNQLATLYAAGHRPGA
jgi:hypothetical protein